jgi:rhodanese-related sulfurtransferase
MQCVYRGLFFLLLFCLLTHPVGAEMLAPENVPGAQTIDARIAKSLFDQGAVFIDVRKQEDYDAGHIPGAHHLPIASDFSAQNLAALALKEKAVVIYCNGIHCMGSSKATQQAVAWGWTAVYYYRDGIPDWKLHNHPVDHSIKP